MSLGAYAVSLLAGIEEGVDAVVAGIPVSDFPGLFHRHSPHHIRARAIEHRIMGGAAENVYRVVPPLSFEAKDEAEIAGRDPLPYWIGGDAGDVDPPRQ